MKDVLLVSLALIIIAMSNKHRWRRRHTRRKTNLILTTIINKSKIKILAMELNVKEFVDALLALEDSDTKAIIADATFANITLASSDPAVFTVDTDVDVDGTLDIVGVTEGTATLTVTADVSYKDGNTGKDVTANKSVDVPVTILPALPGAENTDLVVTFGAPKPTT